MRPKWGAAARNPCSLFPAHEGLLPPASRSVKSTSGLHTSTLGLGASSDRISFAANLGFDNRRCPCVRDRERLCTGVRADPKLLQNMAIHGDSVRVANRDLSDRFQRDGKIIAVATRAESPTEQIPRTLEGYASRGVFQGFSRGPLRRDKLTFKIAWHRGCVFDLILDVERGTLRFANVLTNVPANSTMYRELKEFIKSRQSDDIPEHRRIDDRRARIRSASRNGTVALVLTIKDGDYEYGVRKLVHLVHEIFMIFLIDGNYFDYMVENFGLDPDAR